jgi:outer membrane receptor protein involved in Fe transport
LSAGTAFRNPTIAENYFDLTIFSPNPGTVIPNPPFTQIQSRLLGNRNLDPERAQSIEVAHNGEFGRAKTTLAVFHSELKDIIDGSGTQVTSLVPPTVGTESSYLNDTGTLKTWGGEAGVDVFLTNGLTSFVNYSYQYLHDDTSLQIVPQESPRNKANAGLKAKMAGWTGNLWINWMDKTIWPTILSQPDSDDLVAVSSYYLVNAHAGYAFTGRWTGLEIGVTAFNLLNHEHYEILPAQSAALPGQYGEIVKSRWTGTVSYKF